MPELSQKLRDYVKWICLIVQHRRAYYIRPRFTTELIKRYLQYSKGGSKAELHPIQLHPTFSTIVRAKKISMLHLQILALLHFFAISSRGRVLEIGSYIGGSTVAMASAAKKYKKPPIISIEKGGQHDHPEYPSHDILTDLKKNIESFGLSEFVCSLKGFSNGPDVIRDVKHMVGSKGIDLLFIDADGHVGRDIEIYSSLLRDGAVLVLDDYSTTEKKAQTVKTWVDNAVSEGKVIPLGVWGWGTWIGLFVKSPQ